jgi:hypothetical protein
VENKVGNDEGIGFDGRIELCFGQSQALEAAFKDVDAKRWDAVANLAEHLSWELRQQTILALFEVNSPQILLTKAERKALNDYATRWSMTSSEIVRDLIRTVLEKEGGTQ